MAHSDSVLISGLEFYAYHGASDDEQKVGHRYQVDLRLTVDIRRAGRTDRLGDTVNYSAVARRIVEVATQVQLRLLEALAERLAETVLAEFSAVQSVWLRVQKMCPPMNAIVASVGVEVERSR